MSIDPYTLCPCGSGKKLKFCCSDSIGDIERIHRMIEGEQPRAALRHAEQSLAKHPDRASLLDLKATLELSLDELESARATVEQFLAAHPDSPAAHACQALLLSQSEEDEEVRASAAALQQALSLLERDMPQRVHEALGAVGSGLLMAGHVVAAQAHLWIHAVIAPRDDVRARELLVSLNHYSGLPLLLRDQLHLRPWPEDVPWKAEAEEATRLSDNGRWQEAVAIVDRLGQAHGADPALVYNRALLGGWLADEKALVAGLHGFAQLDVPLDDAVEAEAVAQLLDPNCREEQFDSVARVYDVEDIDTLVTQLTSDRRVASFELDPESAGGEDQPRPRHTFLLLDRPLPNSGVGLSREEMPQLIGAVALFGRQTDRHERLELTTDKGPGFDATVGILESIAGGSLGQMTHEHVVGHISPTQLAINRRWHLPADTPPNVRRRLLTEEHHESIVERWPKIPRLALGGKTPREAAGDPELRIPLLAVMLVLEHGAKQRTHAESIAELRRRLGLAPPESITPPAEGVFGLPLVRVTRLQLEQVSDDDLVDLYRRARLTGAELAVLHIAREAVRRPSLSDRIPLRDAYRHLIAAEDDSEGVLARIAEARSRGTTPADQMIWDLAELEHYIVSGDGAQASALVERIQREHSDDPNMAAALYNLLYRLGAIREEDEMLGDAESDDASSATPVGAVHDSGGSRIWTPDSDRPAGGKSSLWTPS
jgi:hypothetical protein